MILILILLLTIIYIQFGLLVLIQIICWLVVFISSNVLIGLNPWNIKFHITRILSICVIIFILWINSSDISIQKAILLPLSISKIDFFEDIKDKIDRWLIKFPSKNDTFYFWDDQEIKEFLNSLGNENYIVSMEFIPSELDGDEVFLLSKPICINKHSSTTTIRKFIDERLYLIQRQYNLEDIVFQSDAVGPMIKLHYYEIHII